jgi:hypothetical protein
MPQSSPRPAWLALNVSGKSPDVTARGPCGARRDADPGKHAAGRDASELETAIYRYIEHQNKSPKSFIWTKTADQILASIARFCERTLDSRQALVK